MNRLKRREKRQQEKKQNICIDPKLQTLVAKYQATVEKYSDKYLLGVGVRR